MARIFCFLLFVWLVSADQEEGEGGKCERIKLPLCQDLGYNWTAMPNLMGHKDQKEAENAELSTIIKPDVFLSSSSSSVAATSIINSFGIMTSAQNTFVVKL
ncbi:hypothetical protein HF086_007380 [Spodoptera exigua]|uniref:FZ domain-containing protein n=1 Tax=Spodoptera exigua TaxID=7107 RepID=A0A922MHG9_SPOEX|nr:hypothetical protein HF086_007380 [Spodoptera exigua]